LLYQLSYAAMQQSERIINMGFSAVKHYFKKMSKIIPVTN